MMIDSEYFRDDLAAQVAKCHDFACVRILTYTGGDYLVKEVVKTYDGAVSVSVYLDAEGASPVIRTGSALHDFDVRRIVDSHVVTLPFDNIASIVVVPAMTSFAKFH